MQVVQHGADGFQHGIQQPWQQCASQGVLQAAESRYEGVYTLGQIGLVGQARHLGQIELAGERTPICLRQLRCFARHHVGKKIRAFAACRCVAHTSTPVARASL